MESFYQRSVLNIQQKPYLVEWALGDPGKDDGHRIDPVFGVGLHEVEDPDAVGRELAAEKHVDEVNVSNDDELMRGRKKSVKLATIVGPPC